MNWRQRSNFLIGNRCNLFDNCDCAGEGYYGPSTPPLLVIRLELGGLSCYLQSVSAVHNFSQSRVGWPELLILLRHTHSMTFFSSEFDRLQYSIYFARHKLSCVVALTSSSLTVLKLTQCNNYLRSYLYKKSSRIDGRFKWRTDPAGV